MVVAITTEIILRTSSKSALLRKGPLFFYMEERGPFYRKRKVFAAVDFDYEVRARLNYILG